MRMDAFWDIKCKNNKICRSAFGQTLGRDESDVAKRGIYKVWKGRKGTQAVQV